MNAIKNLIYCVFYFFYLFVYYCMTERSPRSMPSVESAISPPRAKHTHSVSFSNGKPPDEMDNGNNDINPSSFGKLPFPLEMDNMSQSSASSLPKPVTKHMEVQENSLDRLPSVIQPLQQNSLSLGDLQELTDDDDEKLDDDSIAESGSIALATAKHFTSILPDGFSFDNEDTQNPLTQLICSQNRKRVPNWDEVLLYIQSNPMQCKRLHGWDEELPLHWALREKAPVYIIEPLLKNFPEGSACRGRHGALPLWYALGTPREFDDMETIVDLLLKEYPHGVRVKVDKLLPIHMAVKLGVAEKIIGMLLDLDLPFTDDGFPVTYHAFSWSWLIEHTGIKYINIVKEVILKHPSIAQELAKAQTERGTLALQIGHKDMRQMVFNEAFFCGRYEISTTHPIHKSASVVVVHAMDHKADLSYAQAFDDQMTALRNASELDGQSEEAEKSEMDEHQFIAALQRVGGYVDGSADDLRRIFGNNGIQGGKMNTMSKNEFVRYCNGVFHSPREVVIKFMTSEFSFLKEYNARASCNLDCRYVVSILNTLSGKTLNEEITKLDLASVKSMDGFNYGIVMRVAERSLESVCIHEDLDTLHICKIMRDLALSLQHIHARGMCHGDVRMRNAMRIGKRYCLIDLTASANLEIFYIQDADMFGSKFRTAMLPPEMFVKLSPHGESCIGKYWSNSENFDERWPHVKPVRTHMGTYTVRAYDLDSKTKRPRDLHLLPYSPLSASISLDMWGYGLLLYNLCCGEPLLYSSRNDDIVNPADYAAAALWTEASLQKKIDANILDPIAADLIMQLLQPNPECRPSSMKQVLEHVYFSALDDGVRKSVNGQKMEEIFTAHAMRTHEDGNSFNVNDTQSPMSREKVRRVSTPIKEISGPVYEISSRSVFSEVKRSHQILRRFLFGSSDTYIPTCFIIVNQKLNQLEKKKNGTPPEDMSKKNIQADSQSEESDEGEEKSQLIVHHGSSQSFFRKNQTVTARRWYNYFYTIAAAQRRNDSSTTDIIAEEIKKMSVEEELYLYFMDEITMQIIHPDKNSKKLDGTVYPLRITDGAEFIPKVFPLMKVSLHAIAAFRDMEVMCRSFGFPPDSLEDVDIHSVNCLGEISALSAEKDFEDTTRIIEESGLLNVVATTPKKQSDVSGQSTPPRDMGMRDASLYKILASRVLTEDNIHTGSKNSCIKELGIFFAAHDVANGYGKLQKVQIKDSIVTYTTKSCIEKFMKSASEDKGDEKKRTGQSKRNSNDSVLSNPVGGSGAVSVEEVNDNVMHLRDDIQRLQRIVERLNKREEQRLADESNSSFFFSRGNNSQENNGNCCSIS